MAKNPESINTTRTRYYKADGGTTGLTDLVILIRDADGNLVDSGDITVTETMGLYKVEYPLNHTVGTYLEIFQSASNGDNNAFSFDTVDNAVVLDKLDEIITLLNKGDVV